MMKKVKAAVKSGSKREEVLAVASECFLNKGYDGTSINVMAREAGISKESIYRYFGSKEDLFLAVVERELEVYKGGMEDTSCDYYRQSLRDALYHLAESALKVISADHTMALRRLVFQMTSTHPKVGRYYYEAGPQVAYRNIRQILDYHLAHSDLKTDCDTDKLSHYFVSLVLHTPTLEKECGVRKALTAKEVQKRCQEVVDDFLTAFFVNARDDRN